MGINPLNFNFQPQDLGPKFGDAAKSFLDAYNGQQKRGEDRAKALAENAMAKLKLEREPDRLDAEIESYRANSDYLRQQAKFYPDFIRAQVESLIAQGRLHEAQMNLANYDLKIKQVGVDALSRFNKGGQEQPPTPLQPVQPVQPGQSPMPNLNGANPFNGPGSQNYGQIEVQNQGGPNIGEAPGKEFNPDANGVRPMETPPDSAPENISQEYPDRQTGSGALYKDIQENPALGFALEQAGYKIPEAELKKHEAQNESAHKAYISAVESARNAGDMLDTVRQVKGLIADLPAEVQDAVGPFNNLMAKYAGDPETQNALGAIMTTAGELQADYARKLSSKVTDKDLQLAGQVKFVPSEPFDLMRGKLEVLEMGAQILHNRDNLRAELLDKNYKEHQIDKIVRERYPSGSIATRLKSIRRQEDSLNAKNALRGQMPSSINGITLDQVRAEKAKRQAEKARRQGGQ